MFKLLLGGSPVIRIVFGAIVLITGVVALVNPAALEESSSSALGPGIFALLLGALRITSGLVSYVIRHKATTYTTNVVHSQRLNRQ